MTKKSVAQICAIAAVVALPTLSWAGTSTSKSLKASAPAPAPQKLQESAITGDIGLNVVTAYYSRGIIQNNHAPSFQPYADIFFKAYEGDGFLNKAVLNISVWNSFTKKSTFSGSTSSTRSWYESDFTPGIALTFGKVTLTESYLIYMSPNDVFPTAEGLQSKLSFDDSDLLGALALHPSFTHLKELSNKLGTTDSVGPTAGSSKGGSYWELAIAPGIAAGPVNLTFPISVAFGSDSFYQKDGYGYTAAGVNAAYTLPIDKSFGTWTANLGGTYYNLNRTAVGGNAHNDVVGTAGLAVAF